MARPGAGTLLSLPGFEIASELRRTRNHRFHLGRRAADGLPVIIKYASAGTPAADGLEREFDLIRGMRAPGIIRALDLIRTERATALILEDFGGRSIRNLLRWNKLRLSAPDLAGFISIALKLTEVLDYLHGRDMIHRDLSPENILLNRRTGELKLLDFSAVSLLSLESEAPLDPAGLDGAPYISPERTGRMNRLVDYRSDYYSLGVILYELLTGRRPFEAAAPRELMYVRIAVPPPAPGRVRPEIPPAISRIIMKLLAREAEDRYRGTSGLRRDLLRCRDELAAGFPADFQPGEFDGSHRFRVPDKLYGRESEIERLMESFAEARAGATRLVLVRGYPGIGKSVLVQEIRKHVLADGGLFAGGKFNQYKRDVPYSALVQVFRELIRGVLGEAPERIARLRALLTKGLGDNGGVLTAMLRELVLVIGEQPPAAELPPADARNRLHHVLRVLLRSFARPEHPLVLFLDDLQWADPGTLEAIRLFVRDDAAGHFLLICAYRDNRTRDLEVLEAALARLRGPHGPARSIALRPLSMSHARELVMDTLRCEKERAAPLARIIMAKTGGNPFFANEFLRTLHRRGLLLYDDKTGSWRWDVNEIESRDFSDNVVDLLAGNIRGLSREAGRMLQLAACLGGTFKLNTLAMAGELDQSACMEYLWEAVQSGIILPLDESRPTLRAYLPGDRANFARESVPAFRFPHDRVQQAAYSLISEREKGALHLDIARRLMRAPERSELLPDIVHHLNRARNSMTEPGELLQAARMNLAAAEKAREVNAYNQAGDHLEFAREFLEKSSDRPWDEHYELSLRLHRLRAECLYLAREFVRAEEVYELLAAGARTPAEKAEILHTKTILLFGANQYAQAIAAAREGLRLFGIDLPARPGPWTTGLAAFAARRLWSGRSIASFVHQRDMTLPHGRVVLKLLAALCPPAYITNPSLMDLTALKMAHLSMRHGNAPESASAYASYGFLLAGRFGRYQAAHEFGNLAVRLVEKFNHLEMKCSVRMVQAIFINHWVVPLRTNIPLHRASHEAGVRSGDFPHASYVLYCGLWQRLMAGENLFALEIEYKAHTEFIRRTRDQDLIAGMAMMMAMLHRLRDPWGDAALDVWFHEDAPPPGPSRKSGDYPTGEHFRDIACMLTTFFEGRYEDTLSFARRADGTRAAARGQITEVLLCFYRGMAAARLFHMKDGLRDKSRLRRVTRKAAARMAVWAGNCPENFAGKYLLLRAEVQSMSARTGAARDLLRRALRAARSSGFPQEIALGCESMAALYTRAGHSRRALGYARWAARHYQAWDANLPLFNIGKQYPGSLSAEKHELERDPITPDSKELDAKASPRTA